MNSISNKPIFNDELRKAIKNIREKMDVESEKVLLNEIRNAKFLAPVIFEHEPKIDEYGNQYIDPSDKVQFYMLRNGKGEAFFPAFTDHEELKRWFKDQKTTNIVLNWKYYGDMVFASKDGPLGFVINPASENMTINKNILLKLQNEQLPEKVKEVQGTHIDNKDTYPIEMIGNLIEYFDATEHVEEAYFDIVQKGDKKSYVLVIDHHDFDETKIFSNIRRVAEPYLNGHELDIVRLDSVVGHSISAGLNPFYTR